MYDRLIGCGISRCRWYRYSADAKGDIDKLSSYGMNATRDWLMAPWNMDVFPYLKLTSGKYDVTKLGDTQFSRLKDYCEYAHSRGIVLVFALFDDCGLKDQSTRWEQHAFNVRNNINGFISAASGTPAFYEKKYWDLHKAVIRRAYTSVVHPNDIIWEVCNEGAGGYDFEKMVIDELRGLGAKYILSSAYRDADRIKPYVDYYCYHNICSAGAVNKESGRKIVYCTDGCGSLSPQRNYEIAKATFGRGSHFHSDQREDLEGRAPLIKKAFDEVTGPTPYACPYCPATFASQADLDAHIASEHPTNGEEKKVVFYSEVAYDGHVAMVHGSPGGADASPTYCSLQRMLENGIGKRRTFLSFDTSGIPDDAIIDSAYIRVNAYRGWGPAVGVCSIDYLLYGSLTPDDYNRAANAPNISSININGLGWKQSGTFRNVNKTGRSQYRIRTNEDGTYSANRIYSGNNPSNKPELHVTYHIPPVEEITTKTTLHTCNVKISYQVSSFPENNDPLTCPNCGMALGVEGIRGSEEIIEEEITTHIITCAKCGSQLKLTISVSIPEKNTEQYCPVCGEPAD